jgi:hypothetical protein
MAGEVAVNIGEYVPTSRPMRRTRAKSVRLRG